MTSNAFPDLYHGRPDWPNRDDEHLFWVGLNSNFRFSHRPQPPHQGSGSSTSSEVSFFCRPEQVADQLLSVLQHSSGGGSILVTGYRGTGKTSVVNHCLGDWQTLRGENHPLSVRVNMATVANAHDVLLLTFAALTEGLHRFLETPPASANFDLEKVKKVREDLRGYEKRLRATKVTEHREPRTGIQLFPGNREDMLDLPPPGFSSDQTFEREALSRYQAALVEQLRILKNEKLDLVFIFDEVDKLLPTDGWENDKESKLELTSLQKIVAELKHFLSESPAHQIFIAGKDVDDSWAEDQNKGEGIFESIFASNIHVASIFTLELEPCIDPLPSCVSKEDAEDFYATLAGEMGIPKNSLVFRAALLILPHLAEYEIVQLLTRAFLRQHSLDENKKQKLESWLEGYAHGAAHYDRSKKVWKQAGLRVGGSGRRARLGYANARFNRKHLLKHSNKVMCRRCRWSSRAYIRAPHRASSSEESCTPWFDLAPTSERTCRRLRILLEYLTYKGRGVPRKILREFYGMVRPASCVPTDDPGYRKLWDQGVARNDPRPPDTRLVVKHVLAFPQHHLQKMNFYAAIVEHLDENFALLRGLNDKGRVSIFHIIDYLLKFYSTGFSHRDLEHAPFMTAREELFPSRQLASLILRIMEGKLWRRKDSRGSEYRMLHHVAHDLGVMFLRYGPEQMELRHTRRDFRDEIPRLEKLLDGVNGVKADERLAPIHAQIRLARILELCGHNYDARLAYYKALRWLRLDVSHFEQVGAEIGRALVVKTASGGHTASFPPAFIAYTVETHQALGRLLEEVGELRQALQHYEEASSFCEPYLPESTSQNEDINAYVGERNTPTWLEYAQALWQTLSSERCVEIKRSPQTDVMDVDLAELLARKPPMRPLDLEGVPHGYVSLCNHAAIAYSKLWERSSANRYMLKAMFFLDAVGDEYGLVDQMFLVGQMMTRRRDLTAAALWYRAALLKIAAIRSYSEKRATDGSVQQWGADWQTPPALATTEAQITAALGDIIFATSGHALAVAPVRRPEPNASPAVWDFIRKELSLPGLAVDDRWEEYFFTYARRRFESGDQDIDARDVYLRQLETRYTRFEQAIGWIEGSSGTDIARHEYEALNAWTTFWRGARVLMHRNLKAVSSLARNKQLTWGRIANFRSMGTMLRLVGTMLGEIALRDSRGEARRLLREVSEALQAGAEPSKAASGGGAKVECASVQFYQRFMSAAAAQDSEGSRTDTSGANSAATAEAPTAKSSSADRDGTPEVAGQSTSPTPADALVQPQPEQSILDKAMDAYRGMVTGILTEKEAEQIENAKNETGEKNEVPWWTERARIQVNTAATDMLTVFAWIGDRPDLLEKHLPKSGTDMCGHRSPLFRLSGNLKDGLLPVSWLKARLCDPVNDVSKKDQKDEIELRFRLLAIAEKALFSSYLCYRDTIPDFSYAQTCVQIGELYAGVIYKLGHWTGTATCEGDQAKVVAEAIDHFTGLAKRFLNKAIDILNREQEQNRNTFHLMSEAWFNLADILTVRLLAATGEKSKPTIEGKLFGKAFMSELSAYFGREFKHALDGAKFRVAQDFVPEDLRRQISEAYQNGLRYAQDEMTDYEARYRVPGDVSYASRNLMDPVLHFRICRAVRLRHSGEWHDRSKTGEAPSLEKIADDFKAAFHEICDPISGYESPQLSEGSVAGTASSRAWARQLANLIKLSNKVRTDRGPLQWKEEITEIVTISWLEESRITQPGQRRRFVFFGGAESQVSPAQPPAASSPSASGPKSSQEGS